MKHRRAGRQLRCHRKCSIYRMLSYWKNPLLSELSNDVDGLLTEMFNFIESFHCSWCIVQNINVTDIEHLFRWPECLVLCHPVMLTEELTSLVTVYEKAGFASFLEHWVLTWEYLPGSCYGHPSQLPSQYKSCSPALLLQQPIKLTPPRKRQNQVTTSCLLSSTFKSVLQVWVQTHYIAEGGLEGQNQIRYILHVHHNRKTSLH